MVNRVKSIEHAEVDINRKNPNKGTERGESMVRGSIQDNGFGRPVLLDANLVPIAGNHALQIAIELGLPITVVETYGDEIIAHVRKDLRLDSETDSRARELAVIDNRSTIEGVEWDIDVLQEMADSGDNLSKSFWPEELDELGVVMDRKLTGVNVGYDHDKLHGHTRDGSSAPGMVYYLGGHELHVGHPTKSGDVAVMIEAWEVFTGEKATTSDGTDDFDEFANFDAEEELL